MRSDHVRGKANNFHRGVLHHAHGGDGKDRIPGADSIDDVAGEGRHFEEAGILVVAKTTLLAAGYRRTRAVQLLRDQAGQVLKVLLARPAIEADFIFRNADIIR